MLTRGACQKVEAAFNITSRVTANKESAGSGNVVNINIKTSNEWLAIFPEEITPRALKPSERKMGQLEARHPAPPAQTFSSDQFQV
jgi:hypothetical protein